jgi:outer membrane biosynthesis protein TonB
MVDNDQPPPAPEPEKKEEAPPDLKLNDAPEQIAINAVLEVAPGGGGGSLGMGDIRQMTAGTKEREDVFSMDELDKKAEAISRVDPIYPLALRKAKIEGAVTIIFLLTEEGRVEDARVETSSRSEFESPRWTRFANGASGQA